MLYGDTRRDGALVSNETGKVDAGVDVELAVDTAQVRIDRVSRHEQLRRRLPIGESVGDEFGETALRGGECAPAERRATRSSTQLAGCVEAQNRTDDPRTLAHGLEVGVDVRSNVDIRRADLYRALDARPQCPLVDGSENLRSSRVHQECPLADDRERRAGPAARTQELFLQRTHP